MENLKENNYPTLKELKQKWFVGNVDGGLRITGYKGTNSSEIIPEFTSDGTKIVALAFVKGKDFVPLEDLVIEAKLEEIAKKTFLNTYTLRRVQLPETVKVIEEAAFENCTNLTKINLPEGVMSLKSGAFCRCKSLVEITLPDSLKELGTGYFWGAFTGCSALKTVVLPEQVDNIDNFTFSGCISLETVTFSKNVKNIGMGAFEDCVNLEKFQVDDDITVGSKAFKGCRKFADSNGFIVIHSVLFSYLLDEEKVVIPDEVKIIDANAFEGKQLKEIILPEGLEKICQYGIATCRNLEKINLPCSLNVIEIRAFTSCLSLAEVIGLDDVNVKPDSFERTPFAENMKNK